MAPAGGVDDDTGVEVETGTEQPLVVRDDTHADQDERSAVGGPVGELHRVRAAAATHALDRDSKPQVDVVVSVQISDDLSDRGSRDVAQWELEVVDDGHFHLVARKGGSNLPDGSLAEFSENARASAGDIVITRKNDRRLRALNGGSVRNGDRWTVVAVRKDGSIVVRRTGRRVAATIRMSDAVWLDGPRSDGPDAACARAGGSGAEVETSAAQRWRQMVTRPSGHWRAGY